MPRTSPPASIPPRSKAASRPRRGDGGRPRGAASSSDAARPMASPPTSLDAERHAAAPSPRKAIATPALSADREPRIRRRSRRSRHLTRGRSTLLVARRDASRARCRRVRSRRALAAWRDGGGTIDINRAASRLGIGRRSISTARSRSTRRCSPRARSPRRSSAATKSFDAVVACGRARATLCRLRQIGAARDRRRRTPDGGDALHVPLTHARPAALHRPRRRSRPCRASPGSEVSGCPRPSPAAPRRGRTCRIAARPRRPMMR